MERNLKKTLEDRQCVICGKTFQPIYYNKVCCSQKCSAIHTERKKIDWRENSKRNRKKAKNISEKIVFITDEEQKKINELVDNKTAITLELKIYKRGSQEFNRLAEEIMRNHKLLY